MTTTSVNNFVIAFLNGIAEKEQNIEGALEAWTLEPNQTAFNSVLNKRTFCPAEKILFTLFGTNLPAWVNWELFLLENIPKVNDDIKIQKNSGCTVYTPDQSLLTPLLPAVELCIELMDNEFVFTFDGDQTCDCGDCEVCHPCDCGDCDECNNREKWAKREEQELSRRYEMMCKLHSK